MLGCPYTAEPCTGLIWSLWFRVPGTAVLVPGTQSINPLVPVQSGLVTNLKKYSRSSSGRYLMVQVQSG